MKMMANRLKAQLSFLRHEPYLDGLSVEEAFLRVRTQEQPQAWSDMRVLDFSPNTDDYLCFLLPVHGGLYLTFKKNSAPSIMAVPATPPELIRILDSALMELARYAPNS